MKKERIQINGIWYVPETQSIEPEDIDENEVTRFTGCVFENDDYCWEATRLEGSDTCTDIKFTDKRSNPWSTDHWDNPNWFIGLLDNDPDSMPHALEVMSEGGVKTFKGFLRVLKNNGWLR